MLTLEDEARDCGLLPSDCVLLDAVFPLEQTASDESIVLRMIGREVPSGRAGILWWILDLDSEDRVILQAVITRNDPWDRVMAGATAEALVAGAVTTGGQVTSAECPAIQELGDQLDRMRVNLLTPMGMIMGGDVLEVRVSSEGGYLDLLTDQADEEISAWVRELRSIVLECFEHRSVPADTPPPQELQEESGK